jgi:phosphopantetheinyl transferase
LVVIIGHFNLVGIDFMKINNNLDINNFKSFFNQDIWKIIVNSNKKFIFYEYWCIIESYFKCTGTGITSPENVIVKYTENIVLKII